MRTFFLLFSAATVTCFVFGVTTTSNAVDRIVESRTSQYCEKGFIEFCE